MKNKRLFIILTINLLLLLIPFIAMYYSENVKWDVFDFILAAILLAIAGTGIEFTLRKVKKPVYRILLCTVLIAGIFIIWAEIGVGLIETLLSKTR